MLKAKVNPSPKPEFDAEKELKKVTKRLDAVVEFLNAQVQVNKIGGDSFMSPLEK